MVARVRSQLHLTLREVPFLEAVVISDSQNANTGRLTDLPDRKAVGLAAMNRKEFIALIKRALRDWQTNNATLRAAALAFFIVLPLPSLLIITAAVFELFYGHIEGTQQLIQQISIVAGSTIAGLIGELLEQTNPFTSIFASIFGVAFSFGGAVGAFGVLQDTLNVIWEVKLPKERSLKTKIRERAAPFMLVFGAAVIVVGWFWLITLLFNAISTSIKPFIGNIAITILGITQIGLSFILATLLFAIIYKIVPDADVKWRDVNLSAVITGGVFTVLNYLFGWYLRTFPVTTLVGAAGALIVLLLWFFVIVQVILFGAQFAKTYAETFGSKTELDLYNTALKMEQL